MNVQPNVVNEDVSTIRHLRWSAIIAGAFVALGLGFLLQLFGVAIGLSAYHSDTGNNTIAMGGILGLLIGVIISMGIAGFVSGYYGKFSSYHIQGESFLYGFLTWSISLLLSALLILPLTQYISSYNDNLAPQVRVTDNMPQHVKVSQKPVRGTAAQNDEGANTQTQVNMTPAMVKGSSWVMFILFFLGAVASCIGANMGMNCRCKHREPRDPVVNPHL